MYRINSILYSVNELAKDSNSNHHLLFNLIKMTNTTLATTNVEFITLDNVLHDSDFKESFLCNYSKEEEEELQNDSLLWFEGNPDMIKIFDDTGHYSTVYFDTFTRYDGTIVFYYWTDDYDFDPQIMIKEFKAGKGNDFVPVMIGKEKKENDTNDTTFEVWYRGGRGYSYAIDNYK